MEDNISSNFLVMTESTNKYVGVPAQREFVGNVEVSVSETRSTWK
jgi:hypothetical protein